MMACNSLITALMKVISEDYPGIKRQRLCLIWKQKIGLVQNVHQSLNLCYIFFNNLNLSVFNLNFATQEPLLNCKFVLYPD